ncbi:MAG TPA: radical SAM protein, partial [Thermoplasmata archaeon]|nr:radical SAM protein [Thermoplasmata archaeon]
MASLRWKHHRLAHGPVPEGCALCEKGAKMVLLVTGLCDCACWYCPLSDRKRGRDVVFANERQIRPEDTEALLHEARMIDTLGTGLTGGDPAVVSDRALRYIEVLKEAFGPGHHIHMYT